VIPPGWTKEPGPAASPTQPPSTWWRECTRGGRVVSLGTHRAGEEPPGLRLLVRVDDSPCEK
jgi:hypothetical protein